MRVSVTNADALAGIQFRVQFDNSILEVQGSPIQGTLPEGFLFTQRVDNSGGIVNLIVAGADALNVSSLTIVEVTFKLIGPPGQFSAIQLTDVLAGDVSGQAISVTTINGTISIRE